MSTSSTDIEKGFVLYTNMFPDASASATAKEEKSTKNSKTSLDINKGRNQSMFISSNIIQQQKTNNIYSRYCSKDETSLNQLLTEIWNGNEEAALNILSSNSRPQKTQRFLIFIIFPSNS